MGRRPFVREKILEAAFDLFAKRGYEAVSSREIAAEAGVGPASMYRHFASMEELGREVYAIGLEPLLTEFAALEARALKPGNAVREILALLYRAYDTRPRALALLVFPPHDFTPEELAADNKASARACLERMLAIDGELGSVVWGALTGPLQDRYLGRRRGKMDVHIEAHGRLVARLLTGRNA